MSYTRASGRVDATAHDDQPTSGHSRVSPFTNRPDVDHRHNLLWWVLLIIVFIL
jgi:hypothetical protein